MWEGPFFPLSSCGLLPLCILSPGSWERPAGGHPRVLLHRSADWPWADAAGSQEQSLVDHYGKVIASLSGLL